VDGVRGVRTELRVDASRRKPMDGVGERDRGNGDSGGIRHGGGRTSQNRSEGSDIGNG
jgi:hypothetical protein